MKEKVDNFLKGLDKMYDDVRITYLSDESIKDVEVISSKSLKINEIIGVNGYPRGRWVSVFGWESCGKTTLAVQAIAESHKDLDSYVLYVDQEQAFDKQYAIDLGVDMDRLVLAQPDTAEQALEIIIQSVKSNYFDIIVLDSIAALASEKEIENDMSSNTMGGVAKLMSMFGRKIIKPLRQSKTCLITINQWRERIGVMFGDSRALPGGNAEKFYSSVRMEIKKNGKIKMVNDVPYSLPVKVTVVKNKLAAPYKSAEIELIFGIGTDEVAEAVELGIEKQLIDKAGSWLTYENTKLQGLPKMIEFFRDNIDLVDELKVKLKNI